MIRAASPTTHASGLAAIARELGRVHESVVRADDTGDHALRLPLMTLVAVCTDDDAVATATETVHFLAEARSARALIIRATAEGPASIEADVAVHVGRNGARCEEVRLTVTGEPALHLVSVAGPLLVSDRPVYLWMVGAPPMTQAFGQDAIAICERVIIDTGAYEDPRTTLAELAVAGDEAFRAALADLSWARTKQWRELVAQSFDGEHVRRFVHHVTAMTVTVAGHAMSAQALLSIGWMASRLAWTSARQPVVAVTSSAETSLDDGELISIRLDCGTDDDHATVRVERHDDTLYAGIDVNGVINASRTMPADTPDVVHLVGGLMENPGDDPVYREAVRIASTIAVNA